MNLVVTPKLATAVTPGAVSKASLIAVAGLILTNCGIDMPARRLHRIVQSYKEHGIQQRGFDFFDYFAVQLQLSFEARHRLLADPAIAKAISYCDPVGEQATNNVMRERKQS